MQAVRTLSGLRQAASFAIPHSLYLSADGVQRSRKRTPQATNGRALDSGVTTCRRMSEEHHHIRGCMSEK